MAKIFKNWASFEARLDKLGLFRMEPGLERIGVVLDCLQVRRLPCPTVQIVGTNGKGSTATFMACLARAHGQKAGLYSSPHFVTVRERVRIFSPDGSPWGELLPEARWLQAAEAVMQAGGESLTYFELVTTMCAWLLREEGVALAVLESGLGGTFDAVSAIQSDAVAFTPIALDHCVLLGYTLEEIAHDKAGAMWENTWARSAMQVSAVRKTLQAEAAKRNVNFAFAAPDILPEKFNNGTALGIQGGHQVDNAGLALTVWRYIAAKLCLLPNAQAEEQGLLQARIPGRMQFIQPVAHSPLTPQDYLVQQQDHLPQQMLTPQDYLPQPDHLPQQMLTPQDYLVQQPDHLPQQMLTPQDYLPQPDHLPQQQVLSSSLLHLHSLPAHVHMPHPPLILDGAHNAHGLAALGRSLAQRGIAPAAIIFNCMRDKEPEKLISHLRVLGTGQIFVPEIKNNPRAMPAAETAAFIGLAATPVRNIAEAMRLATLALKERLPEEQQQDVQACKHPLLICGSLYLLGEFFSLYPEYLTKDSI